MISKVFALFDGTETQLQSNILESLGCSTEELSAALTYLEQIGYIQRAANQAKPCKGCTGHCSSSPLRNEISVWECIKR